MHKGVSEAACFLREEDGFTIISHISPDGDTLGCALALFLELSRLGKACEVVCDDEVPRIYRFMPSSSVIRLTGQAHGYPNAISIDCADMARMGEARALFDKAVRTMNVDHHMTNKCYADINVVNPGAAATGEPMLELLDELSGGICAESADCLYVAIMTDTGSFAYQNTTPETMRKAALLLERGVQNYRINRLIYRTVPYEKKKLLGIALQKLELRCGGRIGMTALSQTEMAAAGADESFTEGIIDHVRDIDTVEVAILIRETKNDGEYKVSLRSKSGTNVAVLAAAMGGGGHRRAAGYTVCGEFPAIYEGALTLAKKAIAAAEAI